MQGVQTVYAVVSATTWQYRVLVFAVLANKFFIDYFKITHN